MFYRATFAALVLHFTAAPPALSQTAEETALLIATGVEAGETVRNRAGDALTRYEKISDHPLVLKGVRLQASPGMSDSETRVQQSHPCRYLIITTWQQNYQNQHHDYRGETAIDLTEAGPAAFIRPHPDPHPKGPPGVIDYPGAKLTAKVMMDGQLKYTASSYVYYGTEERLNRAIAHMRKTYCQGRAE